MKKPPCTTLICMRETNKPVLIMGRSYVDHDLQLSLRRLAEQQGWHGEIE